MFLFSLLQLSTKINRVRGKRLGKARSERNLCSTSKIWFEPVSYSSVIVNERSLFGFLCCSGPINTTFLTMPHISLVSGFSDEVGKSKCGLVCTVNDD